MDKKIIFEKYIICVFLHFPTADDANVRHEEFLNNSDYSPRDVIQYDKIIFHKNSFLQKVCP